MTNILVAFYSRGGTTERLAEALAAGAVNEGATVRLRRAREIVPQSIVESVPGWAAAAAAMNERHTAPLPEDAVWADGIVLGSPTRFGSMSADLKAYIDSLGGLWASGALVGKAGSAFCATASLHGGNEATILSLYPPLAHLGLIIVPTGYSDASLFRAGTPYGASAVSPAQAPVPPTQDDLAVARHQGRRVTQVARALRGLRETA